MESGSSAPVARSPAGHGSMTGHDPPKLDPTGPLMVEGPMMTAVVPRVTMVSIHGLDCRGSRSRTDNRGPLVQVTVTK